MTLNELFKNTTYDDTLFSVEDKSTIESRIFMKSVRGSEVPYITCAIRDKEIKLTPEEAVRQLYIYKLMNVSILRTSIKCYKSKLFKLRIWCRTQTAFPDADNQLPSKYRRWKRDDLSR